MSDQENREKQEELEGFFRRGDPDQAKAAVEGARQAEEEARKHQSERNEQGRVDEGVEETFPASDPPAHTDDR